MIILALLWSTKNGTPNTRAGFVQMGTRFLLPFYHRKVVNYSIWQFVMTILSCCLLKGKRRVEEAGGKGKPIIQRHRSFAYKEPILINLPRRLAHQHNTQRRSSGIQNKLTYKDNRRQSGNSDIFSHHETLIPIAVGCGEWRRGESELSRVSILLWSANNTEKSGFSLASCVSHVCLQIGNCTRWVVEKPFSVPTLHSQKTDDLQTFFDRNSTNKRAKNKSAFENWTPPTEKTPRKHNSDKKKTTTQTTIIRRG